LLVALGLAAAGLAACASSADHRPEVARPTEQFAIKVTPQEDQILLAPHTQGLSPAQTAALQALVTRWRDVRDVQLKIQTPMRGGEAAYRATAAIQDELFQLGVGPGQVSLTNYDPGERDGAPIVVGFTRYEAHGPDCGKSWGNLTSTSNNKPSSNFGCAITANVAAMIANPGDLVAPRALGSGDAERREVVITKYRQGAITSTAKDPQADAAVSSVGR
jgi:pilus assembly protein CpaD